MYFQAASLIGQPGPRFIFDKPLVGLFETCPEANFRLPTHPLHSRRIQQFSWRSVRLVRVEHYLASVADRMSNKVSQFRDAYVLAPAYVYRGLVGVMS